MWSNVYKRILLVQINICKDNIRTLSANIKLICTRFRNRTKSDSPRSISLYIEADTNTFLSILRRILIHFIFVTMYIYCVYTTMSCIHNILKFSHKKSKTFDILLEFLCVCLRHVRPVSTCFILHKTNDTQRRIK